MENRYKLKYDIKQRLISNISFMQGDIDSSVIEVQILDNSVPVDITGENIEFRFLKSDNTKVAQDSTTGVKILDSTNGIVECVLKANTLACVGNTRTEIIRKKDGIILTCPSFNFVVNSSIGNIALSSNYIASIENKLIEWQLNENLRQKVFDSNESIRQSKFDTNEATRQNNFDTNETARQTEYNSLKKVIISENASAYLQNQVDDINTNLDKSKTLHLTSNESMFSLPNSVNGFADFSLEGQTLINLLNFNDFCDNSDSFSNLTANSFTASCWSYPILSNADFRRTFKPNTVYTIKCQATLLEKGKLDLYDGRIGFMVCKDDAPFITIKAPDEMNVGDVYNFNTTFTTPEIVENYRLLLYTQIYMNDGDYATKETSKIKFDNLMILEGDYTDKNIKFFTGIKSVGELQEDGTYKTEVLSRGKNLFDNSIDSIEKLNIKFSRFDNYVKLNGTKVAGTNIIPIAHPNNLCLQPGTYTEHIKMMGGTITYEDTFNGIFFGINSSTYSMRTAPGIFKVGDEGEQTFTITEPLKIDTFDIAPGYGGSGEIFDNVLIECSFEKASSFTDYEPYKEDIIPVITKEPLRKWDTVDKSGLVTHETGEDVLDGSRNYTFLGITSDYIGFRYIDSRIKGTWALKKEICDKFICNDNMAYYRLGEAFAIGTHGEIYISISKSKLIPYGFIEGSETTYIPAFKAWLADNPTTVICQLAEPVTEQLDTKLNIATFQNGTISTNTVIPPTIDIEYPSNLASAVQSNTEAIGIANEEIEKLWLDVIALADKELQMSSIELLDTETATLADSVAKVNEVINIWKGSDE